MEQMDLGIVEPPRDFSEPAKTHLDSLSLADDPSPSLPAEPSDTQQNDSFASGLDAPALGEKSLRPQASLNNDLCHNDPPHLDTGQLPVPVHDKGVHVTHHHHHHHHAVGEKHPNEPVPRRAECHCPVGGKESAGGCGSLSCGWQQQLSHHRLSAHMAVDNSFWLVSVPEDAILTKECDARSETQQSESNSSRHGGHFYKKEQRLTAGQQVALWLTRNSSHDMRHGFSMANLLQLVSGTNISNRPGKHGKSEEMTRNFSSRSLVEKFTHHKEPVHSYTALRKCPTVTTLIEGRDGHHLPRFRLDMDHRHHHHGGRYAAHFEPAGHHFAIRKPKKSSQSSLLKRCSTKGSIDLAMHQHDPLLTSTQRTATVASGLRTPPSGIVAVRPVNRFRSQNSLQHCSRCTSVLSMAASRVTSRAPSQISLLLDRKAARVPAQDDILCKICLVDYPLSHMVKLEDCACMFCKECMGQYIMFEVMEGAYDISCPDRDCPQQGLLSMHQMERLTTRELMDKHRAFRLNTEVCLDSVRTFCPSVGCETICHICVGTKNQGVAVSCPTCAKEFCSLCLATWHPGLSCAENGAQIVARGGSGSDGGLLMEAWEAGSSGGGDDATIKKCPMCNVLIERDAGCAQMMCKRCKHVFCWYCLSSLDDDFLLRHYDSGSCKGKLGHSRASVIWHRTQVIGIFAGFGILLLVASPLLLIAAPCVLCCKCRCRKCSPRTAEGIADKASGHSVSRMMEST